MTKTSSRRKAISAQYIVPFNRPAFTGTEAAAVEAAARKLVNNDAGSSIVACEKYIGRQFGGARVFLTGSCSQALEMAALLLAIEPGDEVIMPSFTFVSTANAFALRGASLVFVDIRPDTMNIDETRIENAVTSRTRAIVVVHYGGVASNMDRIVEIANSHRLCLIEDAAHCWLARYRSKLLGSFGAVGTLSFHETKNLTSGGEGGAAIVNDAALRSTAETIRDGGVDRQRFLRGEVSQYTWQCLGGKMAMNELGAAYLLAQIGNGRVIIDRRRQIHAAYALAFAPLVDAGRIEIQACPAETEHNGHIFYIKLRDRDQRTQMITFLAERGIQAVFHYIPLHRSEAGQRFGRFCGEDRYSTAESERLLRLPVYFNMTNRQQELVVEAVHAFFRREKAG